MPLPLMRPCKIACRTKARKNGSRAPPVLDYVEALAKNPQFKKGAIKKSELRTLRRVASDAFIFHMHNEAQLFVELVFR